MALKLGEGNVSQLGPLVLEELKKKQAALKEAASYLQRRPKRRRRDMS